MQTWPFFGWPHLLHLFTRPVLPTAFLRIAFDGPPREDGPRPAEPLAKPWAEPLDEPPAELPAVPPCKPNESGTGVEAAVDAAAAEVDAEVGRDEKKCLGAIGDTILSSACCLDAALAPPPKKLAMSAGALAADDEPMAGGPLPPACLLLASLTAPFVLTFTFNPLHLFFHTTLLTQKL